jgi:hypothetical protein
MTPPSTPEGPSIIFNSAFLLGNLTMLFSIIFNFFQKFSVLAPYIVFHSVSFGSGGATPMGTNLIGGKSAI